MWLFARTGFYSVVQKPGQTALTVRARARVDLDRLRDRYLPQLGDTIKGGGTDYPFRAMVKRDDLASAMSAIAEDLDYSNFKNMVAVELGEPRADTYSDVWSTLLNLTAEKAPKPTTRKMSYGGVVFDKQGRILLVAPKGGYGGYAWTYPKGRPNPGETPKQAAEREVLEESGIEARVTGEIDKDFAGSTSRMTRYFIMAPTDAEPKPPGAETREIRWATPNEVPELVEGNNAPGRARDLAVLDAALLEQKRSQPQ